MAVTTFRGEKNLGELADKLFLRLTPRQREKVEGALLQANPQLEELSSLRAGTVLKVPDLPELRAKANRAGGNPDDQLAEHLSNEMTDFARLLGPRFAAAQEAVAQTAAVLAEPELNRVIAKEKPLRDLAKNIGTFNEARKQALEERQQALIAAVKQIQGDLQKR
jgi:phage tail protein X